MWIWVFVGIVVGNCGILVDYIGDLFCLVFVWV